MPCFVNDFRTEKDQIIAQGRHQRHAIRHWSNEKFDQQDCRERPGEPFDFYGQDKQDVDHLVGIKPRKGEKQRRDQHAIRKARAEEKCGDRRANHSDQKIECQPERSPSLLETITNEPEKPEGKQNPPRTHRLRNENIRDETPEFAMANTHGIELEHRSESRKQPGQGEDERSEADDNAHESRHSKKTKAAFEFIQPSHCCAR